MKRFVSILLVAMLVISSFAMTTLADEVGSAKVDVSSVEASAGETVSITFTVSGVEGSKFDNYELYITYDSRLRLDSIVGIMGNPANRKVSMAVTEAISSHGFTATFAVPADAAPGTTYNVGTSVDYVAKGSSKLSASNGAGVITIPDAVVPPCEHKWSEWKETGSGTCVESRTCSVCGKYEERAMTHNPIYDKNETHHWKVCSNCGTKLSDKTPHNLPKDWTDAGDVHTKSCSCGYEVSGEHNHSTIWSTDDTYHWHACAECGNPADKAGHIFDLKQEDDKQWQRCRVCGYETRKIDIGPTGRDEAPDMYDNTPHLVLGFAAILFSVVAMVYGFKRKVSRK